MASYNAVMHEVHVLLVDHDSNCLVNTARLLETCHYRVTFVEFASAAITMLLSGKVKFDIVMASMDSPDLHGFKLLQYAVNLDLPIILMSIDDNTFSVMRALENGAFLQIKKPPSIDVVKCLWQHVLREKTRKIRERDPFFGTNSGLRGFQIREANNRLEEISPNHGRGLNNMGMMGVTKSTGESKKKRERSDMGYEEEYHDFENDNANNNKVKGKVCTEWTRELHTKFLNAVEQLGEGRCFPKEILELMNVPGLTRLQVASHLQKCRNDNWRTPEERKAQPNQVIQGMSSDTDPSPSNPRKFGSMPRVSKSGSSTPLHLQVQVQETNGQHSENPTQNELMPNGYGQQIIGTKLVATNTSNRHWALGSMGAGSSNPTRGTNSSPNKRHDLEFFQFQDIDSMIRNLSGLPQDFAVNNPNRTRGGYQFNQGNTDQNYGDLSTGSRREWSSKTSKDGSADSGTRRD